MSVKFSVVIPTYDRANLLDGCLQSLIAADFPKDNYEIIVADNGSTDRTMEVVKNYQDKNQLEIRYLHSVRGVNFARNSGIRAAQGEIVFFVDDDTLMPPDRFQRISKIFDEHPEACGIGGPLKDTGKGAPRTCRACSLADATLSASEMLNVRRLIGGNMALRAKFFQQYGLFDEELSGRGDETEWFLRNTGLQLIYDPDLWVWHRREGVSLYMLCRHSFRQGLGSPMYLRKIGKPFRFRPVTIIRAFLHAVRYRCARGIVLALRELGAAFAYMKLFLFETKHSAVSKNL